MTHSLNNTFFASYALFVRHLIAPLDCLPNCKPAQDTVADDQHDEDA